MKDKIKLINYLTTSLLFCVMIGQGIWLYKVRELEINELHQKASYTLTKTTLSYLEDSELQNAYNNRDCKLSYSISKDTKTFTYHYNHQTKSIPLSSPEMFNTLGRQVVYDYLFHNKLIDMEKFVSIYEEALQKEGIFLKPYLLLQDMTSGETLFSPPFVTEDISTLPVSLGYENKHQLTASFNIPLIFRALTGHLICEFILMLMFFYCLYQQWRTIQRTWHSAKVQTMGISHLEHELRKPLALILSSVEGMIMKKEAGLSENTILKLKVIRAKLMKMLNVTDTMLEALKTSGLKLKREPLELRHELELIQDMFRELKPHAKVTLDIKDTPVPLLDSVYFNYIVINLVDNAIKYSGVNPEVDIISQKDGTNLVISVQDNGIGIPKKEQHRIFRQFYRVNDEQAASTTGFGLGLTFVEEAVKAYRGHIRMESVRNEGTKFTITIPGAWEN